MSYKVLVYGMSNNPGGIESVIMNYFKHIDRNIIHFDFIAESPEKIAYEDQIISLGSKVFHISKRRKNPIKYYKDMFELFRGKHKEYDCLWYNVNSLQNIYAVKLAKKFGIKKIIVHSHNSNNMYSGALGVIKKQIHDHHKMKIEKYVTDFWACSMDAAKWLFPVQVMDKVKIVKNAINVENTKFDVKKRKQFRKKYGIEENIIIGNVGRLHFQKNQDFLIRLLKLIRQNHANVKLLFIGQGPDEKKLKENVNRLGLRENIIFCGVQKDMQACYSAMDIFAFPSIFEGISIALLEAQANGLPIVASTEVNPKEIRVNDNVKFDTLKNLKVWEEDINKLIAHCQRVDAVTVKHNFKISGYDIVQASRDVSDLFMNEN